MTNFEMMDFLGRVFAEGIAEELKPYLTADCEYRSDYSGKTRKTPEDIIAFINEVNEAIEDEDKYTYQIEPLVELLTEGDTPQMESDNSETYVNRYGILLYQHTDEYPAAVVTIEQRVEDDSIKSITLSRDSSVYDLVFYQESLGDDSPDDLPVTVKALSADEISRRRLADAFTWQNLEVDYKEDDGLYIWREADAYFKKWLDTNGYHLQETMVFDDCIGYQCLRNMKPYAIYMYAFGQERTTELDGEYCEKWLGHDFSDGRKVLITYLNVRRFRGREKPIYEVGRYSGEQGAEPDLWAVIYVNDTPIFDYFPRQEMIDRLFQLMYAFNHDDMDVFKSIVAKSNPAFEGLERSGCFLNDAFYYNLHRIHAEYGDMRLGYVRFNDVVYSSVPYIDGYGFFSFRVDASDRIAEITAIPFDGGNKKVQDLIKTDEREDEHMYDSLPRIIGVETLPAVVTERFALKLLFDNEECRKYVLPISAENEEDEAVRYDRHVFSEGIWNSASVRYDVESDIEGFKALRSAVGFKNGYLISGMEAYIESVPYSEPVLCGEVVYEDEDLQVKREWQWDVNSVHKIEGTDLLKVLISGLAFNYGGRSTFGTIEGKRICSLDFMTMGKYEEGLVSVAKSGVGYGFVDKDMEFVIPMKYENAEDFCGDRARVMKNGDWIFIDKKGQEFGIRQESESDRYEQIEDYAEGMCRVSTLRLGFMDLAYHSDYSEIAGKWGYLNESGEEVISPQYIYACDFKNGMAIVCKGEWTIAQKWDNKYNSGRYWTEEELWGAIDKEGNEVIPCIFDEIKMYFDEDDIYPVHYGGWEEGLWGVIDSCGNWLVKPQFEDVGYEYKDGLITFYDDDKWEDDHIGIYDMIQQKVLFEPQFEDVSFLDDGWIEVQVYDENLGRSVEKLIDRDGNEKFHSEYTSIYTWKHPYEVMIRDENGNRHGLIEEDGTVILPCDSSIAWDGIDVVMKRIKFTEGIREGLRDFNGNIVIPAKYYELRETDKPLIIIRTDGNDDCNENQTILREGERIHFCEGMITQNDKEVIPPVFETIKWLDDEHFVCSKRGYTEMYRVIRK